jgi:hypothetical protein
LALEAASFLVTVVRFLNDWLFSIIYYLKLRAQASDELDCSSKIRASQTQGIKKPGERLKAGKIKIFKKYKISLKRSKTPT